MKKTSKLMSALLIAGLTVSLSTNLLNVNAKADEFMPYFINEQGVQISQTEYEKLLQVGYTAVEIETLTSERIEEINTMNILKTYKESYYIKTTTTTQLNGKTVSTDECLTQAQLDKELDTLGITTNPDLSPDITIGNMDGVGGSVGGTTDGSTDGNTDENTDEDVDNRIETSTTAETSYKYLTVYASFDKSSETCGKFFTKVTLEWIKSPLLRQKDIIAIGFSDNVQIASSTPDFDFLLTYKESDSSTIKSTSYDGNDYGQYNYYIDEGLAVKFDLPNTGNGMCVSLSAYFSPKDTGINGASFMGAYAHQISSLSASWPEVTVSLSKPYLSISTTVSGEPSYDNTLARVVLLNDLAN